MSPAKPCSTSCTTGKQVTISSNSTTSSRRRRDGFRKTSIQADVSTRTTPSLAIRRGVFTHDRQVALPLARTGQVQDPPGAGAAHERLHGPLDGAGVCAFTADLQRLFQEARVNHKICAFHVYSMPAPPICRHRWLNGTVRDPW